MSRSLTDEQKENIIKSVEAAKAKGMRMNQALRQEGIHPSVYYGWVRKRNSSRKQKRSVALAPRPVHHTFPVEPRITTVRTPGSIVIQGTPEDIGLFLRSVANGGGNS